MKKNILEIYALAVCFAAVVCFTVSFGMGLYSIIGVVNPEFTLDSYIYNSHQTNDTYWNGAAGAPPMMLVPGEKIKDRPSEADLTKQREASWSLSISNEHRANTQSVVRNGIIILIDLMVFLSHWIIAKRARMNAD